MSFSCNHCGTSLDAGETHQCAAMKAAGIAPQRVEEESDFFELLTDLAVTAAVVSVDPLDGAADLAEGVIDVASGLLDW